MSQTRKRLSHIEQGQTIALMAISIVSLLAMAALAIDLTTLYVAKGEIQRAADTAALAGAKAFVDSGVTTYPANPNLRSLAQGLGSAYTASAVSQNNVAGTPAQQVAGSPVFNFGLAGNPRITVTLQRTGLPLFFARIWGNASASVTAIAIAEAYNSASSQANTSTMVPAAPKCVKPFLVPNNDPVQGGIPFVNITTGAVMTSPIPFIGEQITLSSACTPPGCTIATKPAAGHYLPMMLPGIHQYCPSSGALGCSGGGVTDFEKSVKCCDGDAFDFQQCGTSTTAATWNLALDPSLPAQNGLQCLIHTTSSGPPGGAPEQDTLNVGSFVSGTGPLQITPGSFSQGRYNFPPNSLSATSDSIITVPLFDNSAAVLPPGQKVTIVGFLQLFVNYPDVVAGDVNAYILNVVGCGNGTAAANPVSGGGSSPIPVRLIHN